MADSATLTAAQPKWRGIIEGPLGPVRAVASSMDTAKRFEELIAWQLATELCDVVFSLTESGKCLSDPAFREQIRRASENAPALIAEGFVRYTPDEFVRYLRMARGELSEVTSRLVHADSRHYFTSEQHKDVTELARRALAVTTALLKAKLPQVKKRQRAAPRSGR